MLKEQAKLFNRLTMVVDSAMVLGAFFVAWLIQLEIGQRFIRPLGGYLWLGLAALPIWHFFLLKHGLYASIRRLTLGQIYGRLLRAAVSAGVLLGASVFLIDRGISRKLFLSFLLLCVLLLLIEKTLVKVLLGWARKRGYNTRYILIVGTREKARQFQKLVEEHADWGLKVVGFLQVADGPLLPEIQGHRVLGRIEDLIPVCKANAVDEVVFCLPKDRMVNVEEYLRDLEEMGITMRMALDFYDLQQAKSELSYFHNQLPLLTFHTKTLDAMQLFYKRVLDVLGSLVGLTLLALMLPIIALAIRLDSPGPIFFGQRRVGESGRLFRCWKFRSMYIDAEARKKELMAQNEMKGAIFKIKDDPRITRVGRFLRKTSLDEFPQFWNVFLGEMSLVGTRPPTPDEVAQYQNWHRRRISIKPGITGQWQVSGRNAIEDFDEIVRLDLQYIDNWSLWLDMQILLKTVAVVCARRGSC
jgi:exopolysaccharide biosynthesis polyprenyl glycosylphosphotransferase